MITDTAKSAKTASIKLASLSNEIKNQALVKIVNSINEQKRTIFQANKQDLESATQLLNDGKINQSTFNRLKLDENKLKSLVNGILDITKLEDPVNKKIWGRQLDEGLNLYKYSCPIGVIGVIFEARPDVLPQIASLAIKSGNAVILKGGKEAQNTNKIFFNIIKTAIESIEEFPKNAISLIESRSDVAEMLNLEQYIDLIIPRGGNSLVKYIKQNTKIPVLGHADGICHIYIDKYADIQKSINISIDAKTQYPSACNSVETILINKNIQENSIKTILDALNNAGITIKTDKFIQEIANYTQIATEEDWKTEYGDTTVSIKSVNNIQEAIEHINTYGSGHTDAIITENDTNAELFMNLVDSAGVYRNASTRFADGYRYGFGAEVGISTNKTHARGPVGLEGLTIYKYKLYGNGNIVKDYTNGSRNFNHKEI